MQVPSTKPHHRYPLHDIAGYVSLPRLVSYRRDSPWPTTRRAAEPQGKLRDARARRDTRYREALLDPLQRDRGSGPLPRCCWCCAFLPDESTPNDAVFRVLQPYLRCHFESLRRNKVRRTLDPKPQNSNHESQTRNPKTRTCGGSSGGEAALIASGGSILGLGSGTSISLRAPNSKIPEPCDACVGFRVMSSRLTHSGSGQTLVGAFECLQLGVESLRSSQRAVASPCRYCAPSHPYRRAVASQ